MSRKRTVAAEALVLFDIDGTIIRRAGPHHREALVEAVRRATGLITTTDHIPVQGMLDRDILAVMMRDAGASEGRIRRAMPATVRLAQSIYVRRCPDLTGKVCPGVRSLLVRLLKRRVPAGLVTGNLTRIGWKKLERAGLRRHFRFGAFAEEARDRSGLVRQALRHARRMGWIGAKTRLWLIGDHPNDILAARANRVRSIAVSTGIAAPEELAAHRPDLLLKDLRSLKLATLLAS
jgi:phosphoglycolate phosphatase-like HAD superfamily hydrolase